CMQAREFPLTF
nr:immunoglobulin light chain junction region [Macaca mulatta]MOV77736.1 immunoglobulin light chain junction region [Macaca mulatta]MOV77893.1 immunoglobulin light chain junction region [Macaca mulatta]MOV78853.1 immunoglobulin light chain junction region [Macaca mulatta]MOV79148.1 immunoglobulin light chain junction region [Macaca mulatta]